MKKKTVWLIVSCLVMVAMLQVSSTSAVTEDKEVVVEEEAAEEIENMVLIPAGNFLMGRDEDRGWSAMGVPEMFGDELPAHEVYVDAFYIDKYEVTNRQFKEFVDTTGYVTDASWSTSSAGSCAAI